VSVIVVDTELLTVAEVASLLRCDCDLVRDLITFGKLPAINIGTGSRKFYRVEYLSVQRFKAQSLVMQDPEPVNQVARPKLVTSATKMAWRKSSG
jgi:excisionase family DNA binding protein